MKHLPTTTTDVFRPLPPFDRPSPMPRSPKTGRTKALFAAFALVVAAGCAASGGGSHVPATRGGQNIARALPAVSPTPAPAELAKCDSNGKKAGCNVKKNPNAGVSQTPASGLTAADLRSAYGLPAVSGGTPNGPVIAIVDAFENKNAESDLGVYRAQFGLPACTTKNGCFKKVMMEGSKSDSGGDDKNDGGVSLTTWSDEIALDLAMASAACPNCRLLLVEAGGQDLDSLADAVNTAASYHPASISNSWGVSEGGGNAPNIDPDAQAAFNHPGIAITASAGDYGQVQFPASSPYVTAVGGTTLTRDATTARGWSETAWVQSGFGCSIMFPVPAWQTSSACTTGRSVADVSMIADYNPGVAVYSKAEGGWVVLGGTSVGAPFVAGLYAAANDYGAATVGAPKLYANSAALNAVTGPAGASFGSPNGLGAF
ncbi:MAG: protease-like protein [Candidatus Eremiobacteraeota bacterium]|nr:protease-like protein [Candidatus Eremiobacteraeota bacterium]